MTDVAGPVFRIAHLSDLHCGGQYFEPSLLERAIAEINDLSPDIVICTGDLTTLGFKHEYRLARHYLDQLACEDLVVIPGNHDSRNVGYVHFEELFGEPPIRDVGRLQKTATTSGGLCADARCLLCAEYFRAL